MGEALPEYVSRTLFRPSSIDLSSWLLINPLPSLCERSYEGTRLFLFKSGENLVLSSRLSGVYTPVANPRIFSNLPEFARAPHRMILDGEYLSREGLFFFDILQVDNRDLRELPLMDRKKILSEILGGNKVESPNVLLESHREIEQFRERIVSEGGEGIVAKNPLSTYGQHDSWLKMKRSDTIDCFVIDYETSPEGRFSWTIGVYGSTGQIVNLGKVRSYGERVNPSRARLGSVVEIRFQGISDEQKPVAPFIVKVVYDKTPNECLLSQLPRYVSP